MLNISKNLISIYIFVELKIAAENPQRDCQSDGAQNENCVFFVKRDFFFVKLQFGVHQKLPPQSMAPCERTSLQINLETNSSSAILSFSTKTAASHRELISVSAYRQMVRKIKREKKSIYQNAL